MPDSAGAIISFYNRTMTGLGWTLCLTRVENENGMLQLKKDRAVLTMTVRGKDGRSMVNMVIMDR